MKIAMIAGHACIRVQKMAIPLIERGHSVRLLAMKVPSFWQQYETFNLCAGVEQMIESMSLHGDVDLFHCHNEPSWFVSALKEVTDKPVVLDVHDSYAARSTAEDATKALDGGKFHVRITTEERNNFQLADALVFPGDEFREVVTSEFSLPQPAMTLPSYVPRRFYRYKTRDWHGGLVYEGKVNLPDEVQGAHTGFEYCDYTELARRAAEIGMDFHLYAAREDKKFRSYFDGSFVHRALEYEELLDSIARHDWGLVGNVTKSREWDVAMPNKLFEYMAAGVPVAVMNAAASAKFVDAHGIGVVVSGPDELAERWSEHRECRFRVFRERQNWSMNAHIHKLEAFYREVTGVEA